MVVWANERKNLQLKILTLPDHLLHVCWHMGISPNWVNYAYKGPSDLNMYLHI
jgi:hypothetical protein